MDQHSHQTDYAADSTDTFPLSQHTRESLQDLAATDSTDIGSAETRLVESVREDMEALHDLQQSLSSLRDQPISQDLIGQALEIIQGFKARTLAESGEALLSKGSTDNASKLVLLDTLDSDLPSDIRHALFDLHLELAWRLKEPACFMEHLERAQSLLATPQYATYWLPAELILRSRSAYREGNAKMSGQHAQNADANSGGHDMFRRMSLELLAILAYEAGNPEDEMASLIKWHETFSEKNPVERIGSLARQFEQETCQPGLLQCYRYEDLLCTASRLAEIASDSHKFDLSREVLTDLSDAGWGGWIDPNLKDIPSVTDRLAQIGYAELTADSPAKNAVLLYQAKGDSFLPSPEEILKQAREFARTAPVNIPKIVLLGEIKCAENQFRYDHESGTPFDQLSRHAMKLNGHFAVDSAQSPIAPGKHRDVLILQPETEDTRLASLVFIVEVLPLSGAATWTMHHGVRLDSLTPDVECLIQRLASHEQSTPFHAQARDGIRRTARYVHQTVSSTEIHRSNLRW